MQFSDKEAYWAAVRLDLNVFLSQSFNTNYPGKAFLDNWHIPPSSTAWNSALTESNHG